jgi:FMN phosphatase YigB (HAD superfamily)
MNYQLLTIDWKRVKLVIFDVDGTLYNQAKLRRIMLLKLLQYYLSHPRQILDLKIIRNFRRERERRAFQVVSNLEKAQYSWTAQVSKVSPERVYKVVQKWIFDFPLKYLFSCRYPGVMLLFNHLSHQGILIGIFSDYPAQEKLNALKLHSDCIVCATDQNIGRLKPNPKGLLAVAEQLGIPIEFCLFIGDREDRDGECARRAGMPYLICSGEAFYNSLNQLLIQANQCHKI